MHLSKTGSCCAALPCGHHESPRQTYWSKQLIEGEATFSQRHQSQISEDVATVESALAAFYTAVAKEYGVEEAVRAAQDWIDELQRAGEELGTDWRSITAAAASRLARRVVPVTQL